MKSSNQARENCLYTWKDSPPVVIFETIGRYLKVKLFLRESSFLSYTAFGLTVIFFYLVLPLFFSIIQGTFSGTPQNFYSFTPQNFYSFQDDYYFIAMTILIGPAGCVLRYFYRQIPETFDKTGDRMTDSLSEKLRGFYTLPKTGLRLVACLGVGLVFLAFFFRGYRTDATAWAGFPIGMKSDVRFWWFQWFLFLYFQILSFLAWYAIIELAIKGTTIYFVIRRLYASSNLKLRRFAPDNCGGMRFIGRFCLSFFSLASIVGIYIFWFFTIKYLETEQIVNNFHIVVSGLYFFFAPFFFFGPLITTHNKMKAAKAEEIKDIESQLEYHYSQVNQIINSETDLKNTQTQKAQLEKHSQAIDQLKKQYNEWNKVTPWPVDPGIFQGFLARYLLPLGAVLVQVISSKV